jgi:hypothetical protein
VHTVIDDHSRDAYAEIGDDDTAHTAVTMLHNAVTWSPARPTQVEHRTLAQRRAFTRLHPNGSHRRKGLPS